MFTNPAQADHTFKRLQANTTDSATWYRLELYRGTANYRRGDTTLGQALYNHVEQWCKHTPQQHHLEGLLWNHRGTTLLMSGNNIKAGQCYERAYQLLNQPPKTNDLIATTINLADHYLQTGQIPLAAERYRYALFLADSLNNRFNHTSILCGLGLVYMELENFAEAHRFFRLAQRDIAHNSLQTQHFYHFSLGNCYYLEYNYPQSLKCFKQALRIAQELGNDQMTQVCHINMGEVYLMLDSLNQAKAQLQHAQTFLQKYDKSLSPENKFYIKSLLADLAIAQHKGCPVNDFLEQLPDSDKVIDSPRYLMLHYRRLQRYAASYNQWRKALVYHTKADGYADSLQSLQTRNNVAEMTGRYQRDTTLLRQQITLADYTAKSVRQQNLLYIIIILVIAFILVATLVIHLYRRRTQGRIKQQIEQITELRMDIVRNRVSPHYIFNVLGTVLPKLQRYPELVEPVEMLIDVLRGNLLTSGKMAVALRDELALVHRFVDLHHYSKSQLPKVTWQIDPELEQSEWLIPSMSLQIPVENALKHAFVDLTNESAIHIVITQQADLLTLQVTDNGQGYNPGRIKRTNRDTGTGLRLLTRTLNILNQYNKHSASLRITNIAPPHHGTRVEICIPRGYNFTLKQSKQ